MLNVLFCRVLQLPEQMLQKKNAQIDLFCNTMPHNGFSLSDTYFEAPSTEYKLGIQNNGC